MSHAYVSASVDEQIWKVWMRIMGVVQNTCQRVVWESIVSSFASSKCPQPTIAPLDDRQIQLTLRWVRQGSKESQDVIVEVFFYKA